MFEIIAFVVVFVTLLLLAGKCYGSAPPAGRVKTTRPDPKTVDGFGGARGYDYSYSGQSGRGYGKPFPVGLRTEREKTETHKASKGKDSRR